ncbi:hypothetical protein OKW96_14940 [Sphingobacterium sp. KU25419]|nr:hypothetical protein OKW96_14940 [Sphingobacterium sp. KU25419]
MAHNGAEIIDWFNRLPHAELKSIQGDLKKFVLLNLDLQKGLPETNNKLMLLVMLMEKAEQLGEISIFQSLFQHLEQTPFDIGHRLKAAALYMDLPKSASEYIGFYDKIYKNLQIAYQEEEDSADKALFTMVNYYLQVIENCGEFNPAAPAEIHNRLAKSIRDDEGSFLNCPLIFDILRTDLTDIEIASTHIRSLVDVFLERTSPVIAGVDGLFVEEDSDYSELLKNVETDFMAIRQISVTKHMANPEGQRYYEGLLRGVKILDDERELFAYMVAMGKMHQAKLDCAFDAFDFTRLKGKVNIIDWGCGQGMATMVLLDHLNKKGITADIHNVILVEPSRLALERGGLHTLKFDDTIRLVTIHNLLDGVTEDHLKGIEGTTIHLFANILDIDAVALKPLIDLIINNISGENLFFCTSPYQNSIKTNRLDTFLKGFQEKEINVLMRKDNYKGSWKNGWSRVIRVFTANL